MYRTCFFCILCYNDYVSYLVTIELIVLTYNNKTLTFINSYMHSVTIVRRNKKEVVVIYLHMMCCFHSFITVVVKMIIYTYFKGLSFFI